MCPCRRIQCPVAPSLESRPSECHPTHHIEFNRVYIIDKYTYEDNSSGALEAPIHNWQTILPSGADFPFIPQTILHTNTMHSAISDQALSVNKGASRNSASNIKYIRPIVNLSDHIVGVYANSPQEEPLVCRPIPSLGGPHGLHFPLRSPKGALRVSQRNIRASRSHR
jgi:hypothetical protein